MSKTAVVVNTKGEMSIIDIAEDELTKLQSAVDGLIQPIDLDTHATMWVNEEGLFRSDLEMNEIATAIYAEMYGDIANPLIGDAVFTGGTDEEGETLTLPQEYIDSLKKLTDDYQRMLSQMFS